MAKPKGEAGLVHLYPDPHHYILGEPAIERDVTPKEAERLLAYHPPAYHKTPPADEAVASPGPADDAEAAESED